MRREEKFNPALSSFFDMADTPDDSSLTELVQKAKTNRYSNFKELARGGLKNIRTCHDQRTGRQLVMATLLQNNNPAHTEKFLKEARLNASLQHPNIVPVYDVGLKDNEPWFTMKFLEGENLGGILTKLNQEEDCKYRNLNERLDIFIKVCDAISYAHSRGIIHLDLKPENIHISNFGDVSVCDWGLADIVTSECDEALLDLCTLTSLDLDERTVDGVVKGSPGFMAPEQTTLTEFRKGKHSDIFSLGAILYSILALQKPLQGENFEELIINTAECKFLKPSELRPDLNIPFSLEAVCLKAMQLKPEERYQSVEDLKKEIMDFRNGFATEAENASALKALQLLILRNKVISGLALIIFMGGIAVTAMTLKSLKLEKENAVQEAEKSKLEAERNRIEKEYYERINIEAAPRFFEAAKIAYNTYRFDDAIKFCNTVVELDKSELEAWELKGILHFARQEFPLAIEAFQKSGKKNKLISLAEEFSKKEKQADGFLSTADLLDLMSLSLQTGLYREFTDLMQVKISAKLTLEDRIEFCKKVLIFHNNRRKGQIHFKYDRESRHLDVSNNSWMKIVFCLQHFPARTADFSGTGITELFVFNAMEIEELDISHTKIAVLNSLACPTLKKLRISYTSINNIGPLKDSNIEELNISRSQVVSLHSVTLLPQIKKVIIHKGQFPQKDIDSLPPEIEVVTVK